jgi:hypothetical protein
MASRDPSSPCRSAYGKTGTPNKELMIGRSYSRWWIVASCVFEQGGVITNPGMNVMARPSASERGSLMPCCMALAIFKSNTIAYSYRL